MQYGSENHEMRWWMCTLYWVTMIDKPTAFLQLVFYSWCALAWREGRRFRKFVVIVNVNTQSQLLFYAQEVCRYMYVWYSIIRRSTDFLGGFVASRGLMAFTDTVIETWLFYKVNKWTIAFEYPFSYTKIKYDRFYNYRIRT